MNAREMHYDFKQKLNKIDSNKFRDLVVPEIDWKLNEAQELFVKITAQPKLRKSLGFEVTQRTIDDISTIVINQTVANGQSLTDFGDNSLQSSLPDDYWFFVNAKVLATKGTCTDQLLDTRPIQHDDNAHASPFDRSSFRWKVANIRFIKEGIRVFTDGDFIPSKIILDYLRKPRIIHNAQDWEGGSYDPLDGGATLSGTQSSELPVGVHRDIVDLAVLITAGDLGLNAYPIRKDKENIKT